MSWIALRGECRGCGAPISVRYPLVEALVGFLFLGAFVDRRDRRTARRMGTDSRVSTGGGRIPCIFLALLVAATFIDYDLMIIPDQITVTGMIVGLVTGHDLARGSAGAGVMAGDHPLPGVLGRLGGPVGRVPV